MEALANLILLGFAIFLFLFLFAFLAEWYAEKRFDMWLKWELWKNRRKFRKRKSTQIIKP